MNRHRKRKEIENQVLAVIKRQKYGEKEEKKVTFFSDILRISNINMIGPGYYPDSRQIKCENCGKRYFYTKIWIYSSWTVYEISDNSSNIASLIESTRHAQNRLYDRAVSSLIGDFAEEIPHKKYVIRFKNILFSIFLEEQVSNVYLVDFSSLVLSTKSHFYVVYIKKSIRVGKYQKVIDAPNAEKADFFLKNIHINLLEK